MGMGLVAWGRGARTPQDTLAHLGNVPCSPNTPRGGLGTPPNTHGSPPTPLTHRQVLKLPKQVLEFSWEFLEDKKRGEGRENPGGSGSTQERVREHLRVSRKAQKGLEATRGGLGAPRGVLEALEWG